MSEKLEPYQEELIESALGVGALKFGSYELKSGRISPYFFNAASLNTGSLLNTLASAYATHIARDLENGALPPFDVIFGPAYKGIPLAASVALLLWREYGVDVGWAYDRKEAKTHGEGGTLVGASVEGKRILVLDDVITSGKAIRGGLENVRGGGGVVVAGVLCLDREEVGGGEGGEESAVAQVAREMGGPVSALVRMRDLMVWLEAKGRVAELENMRAYWEKYGIERMD